MITSANVLGLWVCPHCVPTMTMIEAMPSCRGCGAERPPLKARFVRAGDVPKSSIRRAQEAEDAKQRSYAAARSEHTQQWRSRVRSPRDYSIASPRDDRQAAVQLDLFMETKSNA